MYTEYKLKGTYSYVAQPKVGKGFNIDVFLVSLTIWVWYKQLDYDQKKLKAP